MISDQHQQLLVLFGDQFIKALEILDNLQFNSYQTASTPNRIYEIFDETQGKSSSIRLFAGVNYCTCEQFQVNIVQKDKPTQFTCEHVLSLVLAIHLQKIQYKTISQEEFNNILLSEY